MPLALARPRVALAHNIPGMLRFIAARAFPYRPGVARPVQRLEALDHAGDCGAGPFRRCFSLAPQGSMLR